MGDAVAAGLRVIEIGPSVAAATIGMVLADFGADVTVVEAAAGSRLRTEPAHQMWSRGKSFASLDLTDDAARSDLDALVADADVAVVALRPATADRLGVDGATLTAANPRLIHCEITGFGRAHPLADLPGFDSVVSSKGGRAYEFSVLFGAERPAFPTVPVATHGAAMLGIQGIFAALYERERTGRGQRVETSLLRALGVYDLAGWTPGGLRALRTADVPMTIYPVARSADGVWVQFSQNSPRLYRAMMRGLGLEALYDEPRFAHLPHIADVDDARALRAMILERFAERDWAEWQALFADDPDVSAERLRAPGEAFDHPQFVHNGDADVHDTPDGPRRRLGPIARFGTTTPSDASAFSGGTGEAVPPLLSGVTVVELSTWIATPLAAGLMADLGARVIKIEPLAGDPMRAHGDVGMKCIQGKESITVDLKTPEGVAIAQDLAAQADVLLHNYRPGVPERLGIDHPTLAERNPGLVHLYGASYGSTGPMSALPAFHVTAGAICGGVMAQAGDGRLPGPEVELTADDAAAWTQYITRCNEANPDFNAAVVAAAVAIMGLYRRARDGVGGAVETRMMTSNAYTMSRHFGDRPVPLPDRDLYGYGPLHRLYPTADGWVLLAARPEDEAVVEELTGVDALTEEALGAAFSERPAATWEADFAGRGVACVVAGAGSLWQHVAEAPWAGEARMVAMSAAYGRGPYPRYDRAVNGEREPGRLGSATPAGAQTRALLAEIGRSDDEIERLVETGIVGATPAAVAG